MIFGAGTSFDGDAYRNGRQTPVFFGSALNDFGVEPFLLALLSLAPSPSPRTTETGIVAPTDPTFSGFVFKVQANMNPRHRDRVAFLRICSGGSLKDMAAEHERLGTTLRLSRVYRFFGRGRETVPEAYAGDVIGLVNPGQLRDRRHALCRQARAVSSDSALPSRAVRDRQPNRHTPQAIRRGGAATGRRGIAPALHAGSRPSSPHRGRRRRAAVRRH